MISHFYFFRLLLTIKIFQNKSRKDVIIYVQTFIKNLLFAKSHKQVVSSPIGEMFFRNIDINNLFKI